MRHAAARLRPGAVGQHTPGAVFVRPGEYRPGPRPGTGIRHSGWSFHGPPGWEDVRNLTAGARAGFILGQERSAGIVMARNRDEWSDPVFLILTNVDIGFLAGLSASTTMMLTLTGISSTEGS
jgi:hypothetical protein